MFGGGGTGSQHAGYERRGTQQVRGRLLLFLALCQTSPPARVRNVIIYLLKPIQLWSSI